MFDVLAFAAFAAEPVTRAEGASRAKTASARELSDKQQAFVDFVLSQHVKQRVGELAQERLSSQVKLRHNALTDTSTQV